MSNDHPDRQRRLAEALRANLRRRKGQARERAVDDDGAGSPAEATDSTPAAPTPDDRAVD